MLKWEENELVDGLYSVAGADYVSHESKIFSSGNFTAVVYYLVLLFLFQELCLPWNRWPVLQVERQGMGPHLAKRDKGRGTPSNIIKAQGAGPPYTVHKMFCISSHSWLLTWQGLSFSELSECKLASSRAVPGGQHQWQWPAPSTFTLVPLVCACHLLAINPSQSKNKGREEAVFKMLILSSSASESLGLQNWVIVYMGQTQLN